MSLRESIARWILSPRIAPGIAELRRKHTGAGSRLSESVQVYGWKGVRIGRNSAICEDTLLNALNCPGEQPAIVIGDHCFIGRRNFLNAGATLVFGDYCLTGTDCHFLGSDHVHDWPYTPYAAAGNTPGGDIVLGANVWLGARVTVLKGVRIGHGSIVGAASVVTRGVPPFAIAVGHPARVIKRFSVRRQAWVKAEDFTAGDDGQLPSEEEYLETLRRTHPKIALPHRALGRECGDF